MKTLRYLALAALALFAFNAPAFATTPVQGVAAGGAYLTVKVDKYGHIVGAFVADDTSWSASASLTDTTLTALHASAGAGVRNCITWLDISGVTATTVVTVAVKDGSTAKATFNIPAGVSSRHVPFETPICGTAATALNAVLSGAPTGAVQINAGGYVAP